MRAPGYLILAGAVAAAIVVPALASEGGGHAARQSTGMLSLSPGIVDIPAQTGALGSITVSNTTQRAMRITVRARPWTQSRTGAAIPNRRRTLSEVRLETTQLTLPGGEDRQIPVSIERIPSGGSLYGAIEVIGEPTGTRPRGIAADYRLISSLRLNPATPRLRVRAGSARVRGGNVVLSVRNTGNTIEPIRGSARVRGPGGTRNQRIPSTRIVPGATVDLRMGSAGRLPRGAYTATVRLSQDGRRVASATKRFRVR